MKTRQIIAAGVAGAIGLTAAGIGVASAAQDDSEQTSTTASGASGATGTTGTTEQAGKAGREGRGGPGGKMGGARLENLATALGITTDELQTAMESIRPATPPEKPTTPPTAEEREAKRTERNQKLADALKITVAELEAAQAQAMVTGLQDQVTEGRLTQAQADEVKALIEAGDTEAAHEKLHSIREAGRLAHMVEEGKLTQAQADEIQKRVAAGEDKATVYKDVTGNELPMGHGPGGRGPGGKGGEMPGQAPAGASGSTGSTGGSAPTTTAK